MNSTTLATSGWPPGRRSWPGYVLLLALVTTGRISADDSKQYGYRLPSKQQVIEFLTATIDWYHASLALRQISPEPSDLLFFDDAQTLSTQIASRSFDFAKAEGGGAISTARQSDTAPESSVSDLQHFSQTEKDCEDEIERLRSDLGPPRKKLESAHGRDRKRLEAAIAAAESRLNLLRAACTGCQTIVKFIDALGESRSESTDLDSIANGLLRTVPELTREASPTTAAAATQNLSSLDASTASSNLLALISDVARIHRKLRSLNQMTESTDRLAESSQALRAPLGKFLRFEVENPDLRALNLHA